MSYQWTAIVIQAFISFGLSIIVARFLGVDQFGVYVIAITAGNFLRIFLDGGFAALIQRESAKRSQRSFLEDGLLIRYAFGHTFLVMFVLSLIVLTNPFSQDRLTLLSIIFAFSPIVLTELSMAVLRGKGRLARDAMLQVISRSTTALCVLLVLLCGILSPAAILFAQAVGGFFIYFILSYRSRVKPIFFIPRHLIKTLLPLVGWSFSIVLYSRSDLLLCRVFDISRADIGGYGLASRLVEALQVFAAPVAIILFRRFRVSDSSRGVIIKDATKFTLQALAFGGIICAGAFLLSPNVIPWIFGVQYEFSVALFNTLTIGFIFFLGNSVLFQVFIALELQRILMIVVLMAGIFNVVLNIALIPVYGVQACAWISVATQSLLLCILLFSLFGPKKACSSLYGKC